MLYDMPFKMLVLRIYFWQSLQLYPVVSMCILTFFLKWEDWSNVFFLHSTNKYFFNLCEFLCFCKMSFLLRRILCMYKTFSVCDLCKSESRSFFGEIEFCSSCLQTILVQEINLNALNHGFL